MYQRTQNTYAADSTTRNVGVMLELSGQADDTSPRQRNALAAHALRMLASRIEDMNALKDVVNIDVLGIFYGNMLSVSLPLLADAAVEQMHKMTLKAWQHQFNVAYGDIIDMGDETHVKVMIEQSSPAFLYLSKLTDHKLDIVDAESGYVILTNSM